MYGLELIRNKFINNHLHALGELSKDADRIIIVSPFLTSDLGSIIRAMPSIEFVEIYTNLDGYGMGSDIVKSLDKLLDDGFNYTARYNDSLHGKVFLFYSGEKEKGFILTSGNFTDAGLTKNIEFGVLCRDPAMQKEFMREIQALEWKDLNWNDIRVAADAAREYEAAHKSERKDNSFAAAPFFRKTVKSPEDIHDRMILLRITVEISDPEDLYRRVRGHWRLSIDKANTYPYAAVVYKGHIIEIYSVEKWAKAFKWTKPIDEIYAKKDKDKAEFKGVPANEEIRRKYLGMDVSSLFKGQCNMRYIGNYR